MKPKQKVTNAAEKVKIVQQKFSSMKVTPSKFQNILDEFSDLDDPVSDSDIDSELSESDDEVKHDVGAGDVEIGDENDGVASDVPSDPRASKKLCLQVLQLCVFLTGPKTKINGIEQKNKGRNKLLL